MIMNAVKINILAAAVFAACIFNSPAQTNVVTVTNFVTVVITNVVTVTNVVSATPAAPTNASAFVAAKSRVALPETPKYPWKNAVSAGLTLARGNKNATMFTADFQTQKKTPSDEYHFGLGAAYGEQNSVETVNTYKETSNLSTVTANGTTCSPRDFSVTFATRVCTTRLPTWITG